MRASKAKAYLNHKARSLFSPTTDERRKHFEQTASLEQIARETTNQIYLEDDPSVVEWFRSLVPSSADVAEYISDLFPSAHWIPRYNWQWCLGDLIAGITVGLVVVPQAMAYALLARLPPAFGLYTTFTGACIYWIFGTSKDIVIGTTAVGSLLVGGVINRIDAAQPGVYKPEHIAHTLSLLAGTVLFVLGILRLGWLIEFIPYIPISAFVTSAAITIIATQLPTVLGIRDIDTRTSPYKVYVNTLKGLPRTQLDAAIGITCIALLHMIQSGCAKMELRQPAKKRVWSLLSSLRLTFVILLYTLISFLVNRKAPQGEEKFRIVGHIDKGFTHAGIPKMDTTLMGLVAPELPAVIIILIVEHIAIAKSFGRNFGYTVVPSQEMIAQGASNMLSPFVGGYVCTGSFGASAVLSKAGVRTPLAGFSSAGVLVLALYALTSVFFFIPTAALAGLIIHCTFNLITRPSSLVKYWQFSPFELFIWVCGVVIAFFCNLETAIYITVGLSFAMLLFRMARCPGQFRGKVSVTRVGRNHSLFTSHDAPTSSSSSAQTLHTHPEHTRPVYLPYEAKGGRNPNVKVEPAYPGVFIYRFSETFNYINQAHHIDHLTRYIKSHTRRTQPNDNTRPSDGLWCEHPPSKKSTQEDANLPLLKAVILDLSTVNIIDITSLQGLVELRRILDEYAAPAPVEWHFAGIQNSWTRRALAHAGFGLAVRTNMDKPSNSCPGYAYTVANPSPAPPTTHRSQHTVPAVAQHELRSKDEQMPSVPWPRHSSRGDSDGENTTRVLFAPHAYRGLLPLYGIDRPLLHFDLYDAVDAAVQDAKCQDGRRMLMSCDASTVLSSERTNENHPSPV